MRGPGKIEKSPIQKNQKVNKILLEEILNAGMHFWTSVIHRSPLLKANYGVVRCHAADNLSSKDLNLGCLII